LGGGNCPLPTVDPRLLQWHCKMVRTDTASKTCRLWSHLAADWWSVARRRRS